MRRVVLLVFLVGAMAMLSGCGYNTMQANEETVFAAWGDVEASYQRRADLIPNLVEVVKGYAKHEADTLTAVTEARAKVGSMQVSKQMLNDPQAFAKFQQAQDQLGSAISRLLVAVEAYPDLKATQNFRDLQVQLEGTENRIAVERMRYNESAQAFNTRRMSFPMVFLAPIFGSRFAEKAYFKAQPGAETAPKVKF